MDPALDRFVGNSEYCFANSAAMLLSSAGQCVDAAVIECLTAVGVGARLWHHDSMIYFSLLPPDIGLTRAFGALGFAVREEAYAAGAAFPRRSLSARLAEGPVLAGPLDMQFLTYLPGHADYGGVDHYVLLTGFDGSQHVRLHDPKGYPNVCLGLAEFEMAWRAESIGYGRGSFRSWDAPRRREAVAEDALASRCVAALKDAYAWEDEVPRDQVLVGAAAFESAAETLRGDAGEDLVAMLAAFCFPVGARRAHDLARFLQAGYAGLAEMKRQQARAFIDGYGCLQAGERDGAAEQILRIGELDDRFRAELSSH